VVSKYVEFSVNGCHFGRHLKAGHVSTNFSINSIILVVSLCQNFRKLIFRYFICNYILCTNEDIELLLNGGHFGRYLGFQTLRM